MFSNQSKKHRMKKKKKKKKNVCNTIEDVRDWKNANQNLMKSWKNA